MPIKKGTVLGPYEILAHIGAGGMGDVWRARDQRIGRDVAIKVLPEFAAGDAQVQRFEQEARAAGALNHAGLVTIFDVGRTNGSPYIVMELLEGETLREVIGDSSPKPLPLKKAVDFAIQIASALGVAHEKGIVHRDLKPENIFVTSEGRVKILDFGLAKLAAEAKDGDPKSTGRHLTSTGMVVGTPGYMSPEQVRAKPLDHRTDIFAFGLVFYEMLCGRRAFERESAVETMTAILNDEPEALSFLAPRISPALEAIVQHCMDKNPRDRFQSARDLAFQLRLLPDVQNSVASTKRPAGAEVKKRTPYRAATIVLSILALTGGGFAILHSHGDAAEPIRSTFKQMTFGDNLTMYPSLSPDGKLLAYVSTQSGNRDIYVQRVDGHVPTNITADSPADDSEPAFSPDGSQIAFRSERDGGGIFVMSVTGESPHRLTNFGHNPSWSPDRKHLVVSTEAVGLQPQVHTRDGELWIIDTDSGSSHLLLRQQDGLQPSWSPHGKRIAFWGVTRGLSRRDIWTIDPNAPQPATTIVRATSDAALHWNPVWSPDGKYLYFGGDAGGTLNLWRMAVDEASGQPAGKPEPMTLPAAVSGNYAVSQQGTIAYGTVARTYRLLALPFDEKSGRAGAPRLLFGGSQEVSDFEPSPDQSSIAFTTGGGQEDLFIVHPNGSQMRQMTNDRAKDRGVTWAADGKTLYLYSDRDGGYNIWSIRADGSGLARITDDGVLKQNAVSGIFAPDASPDGRQLIAEADNHSAALVHLDGALPRRLERLGFNIVLPTWSHDGKQIAGGVPGGGVGVYSMQARRFDVVLDRGIRPLWLPDGKRILFFEKSGLGIFDLTSRHVSTETVTLPGVAWDDATVPRKLSKDGSTLYVCQTLEQGDIWIASFSRPQG